MLRKGTWAKYIDGVRKQQQHAPRMDGDWKYEHEIIGYSDIEYIGEISIGTPEQNFLVLIDTGTTDLWVPDKSCYKRPHRPSECQSSQCDPGSICDVFCEEKSCCSLRANDTTNPCRLKRRYDMGKSSSYVTTTSRFMIRRKRYVEGFFGRDTIRLGDLVIPNTMFGQAEKIDSSLVYAHFDGVLGLGCMPGAPLRRAVHLQLLEQPIFTVFLKSIRSEENVYGGMITYGGLDLENCEESVTYEPLADRRAYWQIKLVGVSTGNYHSKIGWYAESDTGASLIRGPSAIISAIAKELGAQYDRLNDLYFIGCDTPAAVNFTIGTKQYTVGAENLIIKVKEDLCILGLSHWSETDIDAHWLLGDPFIREYCHIYDLEEKKIGFAKAIQD
ncbi:eukaryotic aspartyl protease [Ancylostoma ceylanicum]|nr:eukaryotic aspartyl protease [Ancylostoma ceylanicum]